MPSASLQWSKTPHIECPRYDTKPSKIEAPILKL